MRVVLDSNVVVSSYIISIGAPAYLIAAWRNQAFVLVVSDSVLSEYQRSLGYPRVSRRHGLTPEQIAEQIAYIRESALMVVPENLPRVVPNDPDDDQIIACALAGQADYIVTGDHHLLDLREYRGIRILSPAVFLVMLASENAG